MHKSPTNQMPKNPDTKRRINWDPFLATLLPFESRKYRVSIKPAPKHQNDTRTKINPRALEESITNRPEINASAKAIHKATLNRESQIACLSQNNETTSISLLQLTFELSGGCAAVVLWSQRSWRKEHE